LGSFLDDVAEVFGGLFAEGINEVVGRGVGRLGVGEFLDEFTEGAIDGVFADHLLQVVHDGAALAVVDVALAGFDGEDGAFL